MYRRFTEMNIDHAAVGLMQREDCHPYFCTPRGAEIIGWAGVDGIHYCTIPEFGEMIFAVSPMNVGDYVHPIAASFRELLELLLTCGDMAALEQCYAWEEEQFRAFLIDCPVTQAQQAVLDALREEFDLAPVEDAFSYVKALQKGFDLSKIPYTEDYYDTDMNPAAPVETEWKVTFYGGFLMHVGKAGEEIPVGRHFRWGEENWYIPAAYACPEGLVVDFCRDTDPDMVRAYIDKWDLFNELTNRYTREQRLRIEEEYPFRVQIQSDAILNGRTLSCNIEHGVSWLAQSCRFTACRPGGEIRKVVDRYGLDPDRCWVIHRCCYPWATVRKPKLRSLKLTLCREPERILGISFPSPEPGQGVTFIHPETGAEHTLTVLEYAREEIPEKLHLDPAMEYPRCYTQMCYTVEPPLVGLTVLDAEEGDQPRQKQPELGSLSAEEAAALALIGGEDGPGATSVGVIGGADGPTALFIGRSAAKKSIACSALRFAPAKEQRWQLRFSIKRMEDISVEIF